MILFYLTSASVCLVKNPNKVLMRKVKGQESIQDKIQYDLRDMQVFTGVHRCLQVCSQVCVQVFLDLQRRAEISDSCFIESVFWCFHVCVCYQPCGV